MHRIPARSWWALVVVGLAGQVAWTIENLYLNLFIYDTITDSPDAIAGTVAASAIAATLAAFVVGSWSDRVGRRRIFIAVGYILWGLSTMTFGLVNPENVGRLVPFASAVTAAVVAIIVVDAVMSFLGAGANDAAFNAWVTDITDVDNRGRVEGVLQVMPLVSMLLVFGALDPMTQAGQWSAFFLLVGAVMVGTGVVAWFLVVDSPNHVRSEGSSVRAVLESLRLAEVRRNPGLMLSLCTLGVVGISSQVFLPYLLIYIQYTLRIEAYALVLAVVLTGAATAGVLGGRVIDRVGKARAMIPALGIYVVGLLLMLVVRDLVPLIVAGLVLMSGFILVSATVNASVRDHTPVDRVGAIQGLRMVFFVLIPMVIGPFIGAAVIRGADDYYEELGQLKQVPTAGIFLAAAVVAVLAAIPARALRRADAAAHVLPASARESGT